MIRHQGILVLLLNVLTAWPDICESVQVIISSSLWKFSWKPARLSVGFWLELREYFFRLSINTCMAWPPVSSIYNIIWKGWKKKRGHLCYFLLKWIVPLSLSSLILEQETAAHCWTNLLLVDKKSGLLPYNIELHRWYLFSSKSVLWFMQYMGCLADLGLTVIGKCSPACDDSINIIWKSLRWLRQTNTVYVTRKLNLFRELHKCNVIIMFWVAVHFVNNNSLDWSFQGWWLQKSSKSSSPLVRVTHSEKGKSAVNIWLWIHVLRCLKFSRIFILQPLQASSLLNS